MSLAWVSSGMNLRPSSVRSAISPQNMALDADLMRVFADGRLPEAKQSSDCLEGSQRIAAYLSTPIHTGEINHVVWRL